MHDSREPDSDDATIAWLFSRLNYEVAIPPVYDAQQMAMGRMERLLGDLGNPHRIVPTVHIAGTKGKGSTAADLQAIATAAGLTTGLYTSPHLETIEERYRIGNDQISRSRLAEWVRRVRPVVERIDADDERPIPFDSLSGEDTATGQLSSRSPHDTSDLRPEPSGALAPVPHGPTFFEITTAIAFLEFADRGCDLAVIEVGLGGRLDSTNVCQPLVTIITSISFDHMRQLGDTLTAIAGEKAGIIKPRVPVVSGVTTPEARVVIERVAAENRAMVLTLGTDFEVTGYQPLAAGAPTAPTETSETSVPAGLGGLTVDYRLAPDRLIDHRGGLTMDALVSNLTGRHQADNLALAVTAAWILADRGFPIDERAIRQGLRSAICPGRIEHLGERPRLILDTAHNPASIAALVATLESLWTEGERWLVFAVSRDKPWQTLLALLAPHFDRIILTRFVTNPRAVEPETLEAFVREQATASAITLRTPLARPDTSRPSDASTAPTSRRPIATVPTPAQAWQLVDAEAPADATVVMTGSFFLAAELRPLARARPFEKTIAKPAT